MTSINCSKCGAPLRIEGNTAYCDYCNNVVYLVEENNNTSENSYSGYSPSHVNTPPYYYGYNYATPQKQKKKNIVWWVLGWIFIFPIPLTILLIRNQKMKSLLKYGLIAVVWLFYLGIGWSGNNETKTMPANTDSQEVISTFTSDTVSSETNPIFAVPVSESDSPGDLLEVKESDIIISSSIDDPRITSSEIISSTTEINEQDLVSITKINMSNQNDLPLMVGDSHYIGYITVDIEKQASFSPEDIVFVSENPEIASISFLRNEGTTLYYEIKALSSGETFVYACSIDGTIESPKVKIKVSAPVAVESVKIKAVKGKLDIGDTITLSAVISPSNADDLTLSWSSSDTKVLAVNQQGEVTAVGSGTASITVSAHNGTSDEIKLTVADSSKKMKITISYKMTENNHVGSKWSHVITVNGEYGNKDIINVSYGDTLTLYAEFTEDDKWPDVGDNEIKHTVTADELKTGFSETMEVGVMENGGRYSGHYAYYTITFTFKPVK
ncbi:MAG: Ig domain-containing protein [Clostridia bacterium]|nr:Ig domain-containing protein [Clostridia bacterium]